MKWNGHPGRFLGVWKDLDDGKWKRIPGGAFPPVADAKEKALVYAAELYALEKQKRSAAAGPPAASWDVICDAYLTEMEARPGLADATRHEARTVTNAHLRPSLFRETALAEHDEDLCIRWVRTFAAENIGSEEAPRFRKPRTVRNVAKHLPEIYRIARRKKLEHGGRRASRGELREARHVRGDPVVASPPQS